MPKDLNGLSDWVLSHSFPMRKNSHACVGRKTRELRRRGRGGPQSNEDMI